VRRVWRLVGLLACLSSGCATIEEMAPVVDGETRFVDGGDQGRALLQKGRAIYLTDCTRCHSVERVNRYSLDRWTTIIERMGERSKLDESEREALEVYIRTAHYVLTAQMIKE